MNLAVPICDVCDRPVDRMEKREDDFMGRVTWWVHCHGKTERVDMTFAELESVDDLRMARAFVAPKLLGGGTP